MQHLFALRPKAVIYLKGLQAWLHNSIWTFRWLRIHALKMLSRWLWSSRETENHASHWAPVKCMKAFTMTLSWMIPPIHAMVHRHSLAHLHAVPLGTSFLILTQIAWMRMRLSISWEGTGQGADRHWSSGGPGAEWPSSRKWSSRWQALISPLRVTDPVAE